MPVALCLCISFNILVLNEHQLNINNVFLGARTKDLHIPAQIKSLRNVNWAKRRKCRCIRLGAVSKKLNVFTCLFQGRYFLLK